MLSAPIDLPLVRRLFATPQRVQGSQFLRREIASRMREKLELVKIEAATVLDAGCSDGVDLPLLSARFPQAQILGLDGSLPALLCGQPAQINVSQKSVTQGLSQMLEKLIPDFFRSKPNIHLICGNFAQPSLKKNSLDVLWSNLALHWHPQPDLVLSEWMGLLRVNGLVMFSSFGPDTMIELRQAFSVVDDFPHTLPFVDMHDLGDMLVQAGFATPVMDVERITLRYQDVRQLFADVRALGGNPLLSRRKGLLGRKGFAKVVTELEKNRGADGRIPLSFEIVFGHAFKPQPKRLATGESIIRLDFPKRN
ncbi:methyltransferase domain-containing protein [Undibacterium sp. Di24W]|uniref:methyltransferase domain-containing protein n=1 Tax=Undibacterium sp. Di24W TaxID=3413033 RepID=UPI003BF06C06